MTVVARMTKVRRTRYFCIVLAVLALETLSACGEGYRLEPAAIMVIPAPEYTSLSVDFI